MTPAARISAAIDCLDAIAAGENAERVLTSWARSNRFAGSKDRAAIRDHVFSALRCLRSYGWLGGGNGSDRLEEASGRALMIGALRAEGTPPESLFTGEGYAAPPLSPDEAKAPDTAPPRAVSLDCPDWLFPLFENALGDDLDMCLRLMQARAPAFLRVNTARTTPAELRGRLAAEGVETAPHPLAPDGLEVKIGARRLSQTEAFALGHFEMQDAASQAVIHELLPVKGLSVLDYCAGGGGKSLALAAYGARVTAHDISAPRMKDIAPRAERAGAEIALATPGAPEGLFDLVLADAPCSGSGSWRRAPQAKWLLSEARLGELCALQGEVLDAAAAHVAPGGRLAYATCSLLEAENSAQIAAFLARNPGWRALSERLISPLQGGDGFFIAQLARA